MSVCTTDRIQKTREETEVREITVCNMTMTSPDPGLLDPAQLSSWANMARTAVLVLTASNYMEVERALIKHHPQDCF